MAGSRRQLRFALSMNGGVSLAVWIGGAVSEIDRLRRGDPFWGPLLDACGYEPNAQVDVMTDVAFKVFSGPATSGGRVASNSRSPSCTPVRAAGSSDSGRITGTFLTGFIPM